MTHPSGVRAFPGMTRPGNPMTRVGAKETRSWPIAAIDASRSASLSRTAVDRGQR
jgi:hypothetical protein